MVGEVAQPRLNPLALGYVPEAPDAPVNLAVDAALGARVALDDAVVLEVEHVVALRLRSPVELLDLARRSSRARSAGSQRRRSRARRRRESRISSGIRHISLKRWLKLTIRPSRSTTRIPSAVDSRVACCSESDSSELALGALLLGQAAVEQLLDVAEQERGDDQRTPS